jgi:DegV family protein with EDD domain
LGEQRPVRVFTDSTSDIPVAMREELGIEVVPLTVTFGGTTYVDGVDLTPEEFLGRLVASPKLPTTSQPSVSAFQAAFQSAIDAGEDVVCITISSELSGTFNSARLAAGEIGDDRVRVVDSRGATMQIGWIVVAAARVAQAGGGLSAVEAAAHAAIPRVRLFALLQTLDYVYKGGRIGRAQHMVGSALAIKPIVSVRDGVVEPLERVRTWKKAITRVTDLVTPTPTDILVLHTDNLPDASHVASALAARYPSANVGIGAAGTVISTYVGPGCIATSALYP